MTTQTLQSPDEALRPLEGLNLEDAIAQQITLGLKDPLEIARSIEKLYGTAWMGEQLVAYAEDLVAGMARMRLGANRRSAEIALVPGEVTSADLKLSSFWIPDEHGGSWKRASDLTADDLEARARHYDRLASGSLRRSRWLRDVADLMRSEGAKTLGKLKAAIPVLPDDDLQELVAG